MMMKVHHLDGLTLRPWLGRHLVNDRGCMICHCLLLETRHGLVLVDTAFGTADLADPVGRLGLGFSMFTRPQLDTARALVVQVEALGFRRDDVKHVVLTHLDLDHAGGIADFPDAAIHVSAVELDAATARRDFRERERYKPAQWAHGPKWVTHPSTGERWNGFESVRCIDDDPDLLLVPLFGHSRGHCGVAVRTPDGWLLHAGDAYFHTDEMADPPSCSLGLGLFQRIVAMDGPARLHNQGRLRDLVRGGGIDVFCAHDPEELARHGVAATPAG